MAFQYTFSMFSYEIVNSKPSNKSMDMDISLIYLRAIMKVMGQILMHLIVVTILLPQLSLEEDHRIGTKVKDDRERKCINSNTCPTWFICNSLNNCQCGMDKVT